MTRRSIIRGLQLFVVITMATFAYFIYGNISHQEADLAAGFASLHLGWLIVAAILALQEGVFGGIRIWVLGRVLWPQLRLRTAVISEFILMFCAGATPGQAGAVPSQLAVLLHSGMPFIDAATAQLMTAVCTTTFFLSSALTLFVMQRNGWLVLSGGSHLDILVALSVVVFAGVLVCIVIAAAQPRALKGVVRLSSRLLRPATGALLRAATRIGLLRQRAEALLSEPGAGEAKLEQIIDGFHRGFILYQRQGKRAFVAALILTFGFFCSRFAVAYVVLLALGMPTEPSTFVAVGPPIVQVVLVQSLLNFALYLSPTPGASGIAEVGSMWLMAPWVRGIFVVPYLVLWRLLGLFLSMFIGGVFVVRYLGTDVLED